MILARMVTCFACPCSKTYPYKHFDSEAKKLERAETEKKEKEKQKILYACKEWKWGDTDKEETAAVVIEEEEMDYEHLKIAEKKGKSKKSMKNKMFALKVFLDVEEKPKDDCGGKCGNREICSKRKSYIRSEEGETFRSNLVYALIQLPFNVMISCYTVVGTNFINTDSGK